MSAPQPSRAGGGRATALQLIRTAERLFALNGLAGVSLRQIATESGSGNTSAVHYHFGSKEGLVQAIIAHRLPDLVRRRTLLKARLDTGNVRDALEAQLLPVLELAETPDNWYASFLNQLQPGGVGVGVVESVPDVTSSQQGFFDDIQRSVPEIDPPLLQLRVADVQVFNLHAAADRERALARGDDVVPFALFVATLLDGLTGYLTASLSPQTIDAYGRTTLDSFATVLTRLP
jgi:AcrR family transcriptional regulator